MQHRLDSWIFVVIFILVQNSFSTLNETYHPPIEQCRISLQLKSPISTLDGLIGMGYDNLRNVPMAAILNVTYKECRTSPDMDFLLPDYMQILPMKKIHLDRTANFYDHWQDYFKTTTETINVDASLKFSHFGISGSYSTKHENTKKKFVEQKSSLLHTSLKYNAYSILTESTSLHPIFLARLQDIYEALSKNFTRNAKYLAELTIRDFGTHLVTQADIGATIEQEDYISSDILYSSTSSLDDMKASASASFFSAFKMNVSSGRTVSEETKDNFTSILKHTEIITNGGPGINKLLGAIVNESEQIKLSVDNLVVIDRSGVPLFTIITPEVLPNIRPYYVGKISQYIKNATEEYYKRNKIEGCMEMLSPNFNFQANVNDSSCEKASNFLSFGGIYQTCEILSEQNTFVSDGLARCDAFKQVNTATGNYTCDTGFEVVHLMTVDHQLPDRVEHHERQDCHSSFFGLFEHCNTYYWDVIFKERARISTYWCRAIIPENPAENSPTEASLSNNHGFLFGGLFDRHQNNPFTGGPNCPGHYQAYKMSLNVTLCLSRDYQLDGHYAIAFNGFFSCQIPSKEAQCPKGYSQHLATIAEGCDVYYCVKPEAFVFREQALIKRPPFEDISLLSKETMSMVYGYVNNSLWLRRPVNSILKEMEKVLFVPNELKEEVNVSNSKIRYTEMMAINEWIKTVAILKFNGIENKSMAPEETDPTKTFKATTPFGEVNLPNSAVTENQKQPVTPSGEVNLPDSAVTENQKQPVILVGEVNLPDSAVNENQEQPVTPFGEINLPDSAVTENQGSLT